jgi:hypothetical protein
MAAVIEAGESFQGWQPLHDTVMGGRSTGSCTASAEGLLLLADVVAEGGGFVSCRSPRYSPLLDLSEVQGLLLDFTGDGRTYKLAVACGDGMAGLTDLIPGGLRWVIGFETEPGKRQRLPLRFDQLRASIRARPLDRLPLGLPLSFDPARIQRFQVLHSRFGDDGKSNAGFRAGPLRFTLHAIESWP